MGTPSDLLNAMSFIIVDDHPLICQGIASVLGGTYSNTQIDIVHSFDQAKEKIQNKSYDCYIFDIQLNDEHTGFDLIKYTRNIYPEASIILLTLYKDKGFVLKGIELEVNGYLNKDAVTNELLKCIEKVKTGHQYLGESIFDLDESLPQLLNDINKMKTAYHKLTQTEKSILHLIMDGHTTSDIAAKLFSKPKTVENHRSNICKKLNISGHNALVIWANEHKAILQAMMS